VIEGSVGTVTETNPCFFAPAPRYYYRRVQEEEESSGGEKRRAVMLERLQHDRC